MGFDIYYMVKGYRSITWDTKEFNMGGTSISSQVKVIDTLKYYQTSLANISSTANETEKRNIKESIQSFLTNHYCFSNIWSNLNQIDKEKILELFQKVKVPCPTKKLSM